MRNHPPIPVLCALMLLGAPLNLLATRRPAGADTLPQVLERAGRYVVQYGDQMSVVIGVERYSQWVENPGWQRLMTRTLVSEYAIVRSGDDWLGLRDVYEVDGAAVPDRQNRLEKLIRESPSTAVHEGRRIADESARFNLGVVQRNFNTPTMALFFLHPKNQARFRYKNGGEESVEGVVTWKVQFSETSKPSIIRTSSGKDMPVTGTFWISPADGRVLKTHMQIETEATVSGPNVGQDRVAVLSGTATERRMHSTASITVSYKYNAKLESLVPAEMRETYEAPRANSLSPEAGSTKITCRATYADFRRFETGASLSVPK